MLNPLCPDGADRTSTIWLDELSDSGRTAGSAPSLSPCYSSSEGRGPDSKTPNERNAQHGITSHSNSWQISLRSAGRRRPFGQVGGGGNVTKPGLPSWGREVYLPTTSTPPGHRTQSSGAWVKMGGAPQTQTKGLGGAPPPRQGWEGREGREKKKVMYFSIFIVYIWMLICKGTETRFEFQVWTACDVVGGGWK